MAIEIIDLGTVPLDGSDGDVARQTFEKVNANFAEHETEIDAISPRLTAIETDVGQLEIQAGTIEGNLTNLTESFNILSAEVGGNTTDIQNLENSREYTLVAGNNISIDRTDPTAPVISASGAGFEAVWGEITGTLSDQADLQTVLETKVDEVAGKQLSTEDYTTSEKTKLSGIETGAQVNVGTNISQGTRTDVNVSINSSTGTGAVLDSASTTLAGVMTAADKVKLNGVATTTDQLPEGTTNQYFTATRVRQTLLTGLVAGTNAAIAATDTLLGALAKLQAQLSALGTASTRNAVGLGDVYAQGGILGTVSSDGSGVPTGAIIERGSNANGEYVKWADGTLICRHRQVQASYGISAAFLGGFRGEGIAWTFPHTFVEEPRVLITSEALSSFGCGLGTPGTPLTTAIFFWFSVASQGPASRSASLLAHGKWR